MKVEVTEARKPDTRLRDLDVGDLFIFDPESSSSLACEGLFLRTFADDDLAYRITNLEKRPGVTWSGTEDSHILNYKVRKLVPGDRVSLTVT